jgi:hypothetical protein
MTLARDREEKPQPFLQGDLNGLCGLYAIANAVTLLLHVPHVRDKLGEDVFQTAAQALPKAEWPKLLWEGIGFDALEMAAKRVCRRIYQRTKIKVLVGKVRNPERFHTARAFAGHLDATGRNGSYSSAIIRIDWSKANGGHAHWTVFDRVSGDALRVFDGADERHFPLDTLRLGGERGDRLTPAETLLFRIAEIEGEKVPR